MGFWGILYYNDINNHNFVQLLFVIILTIVPIIRTIRSPKIALAISSAPRIINPSSLPSRKITS